MSLAEDNEWIELKHDITKISGEYIIEEKPDDEVESALIRRLIFLENQNFIQTECRLLLKSNNAVIDPSLPVTKSKLKRLKKKAIKNNTNISDDNSLYIFDYNYIDDHHKAMLASFSLLLTYYNPMSTPWYGVIIGLGGGSLPSCLQYYFSQSYLTIIELDGEIEAAATEYFGFKKSIKTEVVVDDGMEFIRKYYLKYSQQASTTIQSEHETDKDKEIDNDMEIDNTTVQVSHRQSYPLLSYIIIDVDGKDSSLGMTAPPLPFIEYEALLHMYDLLLPRGLLIINVVARGGEEPVNALIDKIKTIFQIKDNTAVDPTTINTTTTATTTTNNNNNSYNDNILNGKGHYEDGKVYLIKPTDNTVNVILVAQKGYIMKNNDTSNLTNYSSQLISEIEINDNTTAANNNNNNNTTTETKKKKNKSKKSKNHKSIELTNVTNDDLKHNFESFLNHRHHITHSNNSTSTSASASGGTSTDIRDENYDDKLGFLSLINNFKKM